MNVDESYKKALVLIDDVSSRIEDVKTEQDARVQLINRFLTEVLGWNFDELSTEPYSPAGYADYLLSANSTKSLIIEAKRTGSKLVDTVSEKLSSYKISGPAISTALDGVRQAVSYSIDHGVEYGAVTNGISWLCFIIFPGGGRSYKDTKAIVFPSFRSIIDNYAIFYDLFSRDAVVDKLYRVHFAKQEGLDAVNFEPMVSVNREVDLRMLPKSELAQDLDPLFREFFGVMSGDLDKEMLLECFVESRESRTADAALQKLIGTIASSVDTLSPDTGSQLIDQIKNVIETKHGENILIVGNKGAGKSTFIDRFFKLILTPEFLQKCLIIKVDYLPATGDARTVPTDTTALVKSEIERQLFTNGVPTYDQLLGLYFDQYQKWSIGQYKHLYESDKQAFQIKFGDFLNEQINNDPHQYVRRLLKDVTHNRRLLPCFIFDNTDHHPETFQEAVFQWSQSIRHDNPFSLVILPITDRTIWKMSKHGPFQTHGSKLFYLPVPSTHEVLEKRVSYLKSHVEKSHKSAEYFLNKGIRMSLENINAFAACIEEIFIREDFIARRIGWLSNHDIRRGLVLSKNIVTSPFLSIDDLMAGYIKSVTGSAFVISYRKFTQALIQNDYNQFKQMDSPFVIDIFSTVAEFPTSPLLKLSILKLLIDKAGDDAGLGGYTPTAQIQLYFSSMGVREDALGVATRELMEYRLIEPFDASSNIDSLDQRVAVTHSGRMHYEMAVSDPIYYSQMAFATPLRSASVVDKLRTIKNGKMFDAQWAEVRRIFSIYCFAQDRMFVRLPKDKMFDGQRQLRKDLSSKWIGYAHKSEISASDNEVSALQSTVGRSHISCKVKWFDSVKGFGFVDAGLGTDIFFHVSSIQRAGVEMVGPDDQLICDVGSGKDGKLQVIQIHSIERAASDIVITTPEKLVKGEVLFYNPQKGYGFVKVSGYSEDIYLSASLVQKLHKQPNAGDILNVVVGDMVVGRGRSIQLVQVG